MGFRRSRWATLLVLVAALGGGCASEGKTNVWGQRWNIPYGHNTVGAELGVWPQKGLDLYLQWVTPRLLAEGRMPMADEAHRQRVASLLDDYIVVRVVAVNHRRDPSHPFDYNAWRLLVRGREQRPVVLAGEKPTTEGGYFVGRVQPFSSRSGWLFFSREDPGPQAANIIYDFGHERIAFSFPPHQRR
ncbi:MAG: hypothetical protein ACE5KY_04460 [Candidatus Tectimicrobiota bacterium]